MGGVAGAGGGCVGWVGRNAVGHTERNWKAPRIIQVPNSALPITIFSQCQPPASQAKNSPAACCDPSQGVVRGVGKGGLFSLHAGDATAVATTKTTNGHGKKQWH